MWPHYYRCPGLQRRVKRGAIDVKVKVTSEVSDTSVIPFVVQFIVLVCPLHAVSHVMLRWWLFTLTRHRTKANDISCKGRRKSNNHWTATPPFLRGYRIMSESHKIKTCLGNISSRFISDLTWLSAHTLAGSWCLEPLIPSKKRLWNSDWDYKRKLTLGMLGGFNLTRNGHYFD